MSYQGYDRNAVPRLFKSVLPEYEMKVTEVTMRSRPFQRKMDERGQISYNRGGNGYKWPVYARLHTVRPYNGSRRRSFESMQPLEHAYMDHGGYEVTDSMKEHEYVMAAAAGQARVVDIFNQFLTRLMKSIVQGTSNQFFVDGSLPQNADYWKGLGTINKHVQTFNSTLTTTTARTANNNDLFFVPAGSYAGLSMVLGALGGAQSSVANWPYEMADPEYDAWSSVKVNYSSTLLSGSANTFAAKGEEAISILIEKMLRKELENGGPTDLFLGTTAFQGFKTSIRSKQRILVGPSAPSSVNTGINQNSVLTDEGVEVTCEYGINQHLGYAVNMADMEIHCALPKMFDFQGPEYSIEDDDYKVAVRNLSRFVIPQGPQAVGILDKVA